VQDPGAVLLIAIATVLLCTAVLGLYARRVARVGRPVHDRLGDSPGSVLLPGWIVEAFYWALHAPGRALTGLRVEPDAITYASVALSLASLPLAATGHFVFAALAVAAGGGLDAIDGMVARARGRACPAGAVLDSFVDRIADAAPFAGLVIFYRQSVAAMAVPLAAMTASSLVSYARAKADIYRLAMPNGVMRRHERVVYLVVALLLGPVLPRLPLTGALPCPATLACVAIIAAVGLAASILLIARIRAALVDGDPRARASAPRDQGAGVS
jgi:CDP-diacylglycerol--glycerol-3-phosphate 3-phosphatidyltransferase